MDRKVETGAGPTKLKEECGRDWDHGTSRIYSLSLVGIFQLRDGRKQAGSDVWRPLCRWDHRPRLALYFASQRSALTGKASMFRANPVTREFITSKYLR